MTTSIRPSFRSALRVLPLAALLALGLSACASTASIQDVRASAAVPGPASGAGHAQARAMSITVDKAANDERGESTTLERALVRELRTAGYVIGEGDLRLRAALVKVERGSTIVNVTAGAGLGADSTDVAVSVQDASGKELHAFVVHGRAADKRYRDLHQVLAEDVPRAVREELARVRAVD